MSDVDRIKDLLSRCTPEQREDIFAYLREEFAIHPLEARLHTPAEVILEAIARAGGLTLRMIRGVIAEAAFVVNVVEELSGWRNETPDGDLPYDFLLADDQGKVRVQVKLQRSRAHRPMMAREAYRFLPPDMYVVETQRTRRGIRRATGGATRPYRFGEFDLLAVCLQPSTDRWDVFRYTVADWLLPGRSDPAELLKYQPVPAAANEDWTDTFETAVAWLRSGVRKTIGTQ
jgi:hypothetical protein